MRLQIQRRIFECIFLLSLAAAIFLLVSLVSYHHNDPAWSDTGGAYSKVHNLGGVSGALLADLLLSLCGYVAYMLPPMIVSWGASYWYYARQHQMISSRERWLSILLRAVSLSLMLLSLTGLFSLYLPPSHHLPFTAGGVLGNVVDVALRDALGSTGFTLILLTVLLCSVTVYSGLSWLRVADFCGRLCWEAGAWLSSKSKQCLASLRELSVNATGRVVAWVASLRARKQEDEGSFEVESFSPIAMSPVEEDRAEARPVSAPEDIAAQAPPPPVTPPSQTTEPTTQDWAPKPTASPQMKERPKLQLLDQAPLAQPEETSHQYLESMSQSVEANLKDFGVSAKVVAAYPGPVVTRFELQLAAGTKVSKVSALAKDLARSLSVKSVRIVEIIPGKSVIGLESPNHIRQTVRLSDILGSREYKQSRSVVTLALGKDIAGHSVVVDLAKMPHLLVAGTTGSGKSVGLNAILMSLLFKSTPDELRLILIDPKMLELAIYAGIPHLLTPVVTDMKDAACSLRWCVAEMERRYRLMAALGVRNLAGFNEKVMAANKANKPLVDPLWEPIPGDESAKAPVLEKLPTIVVMADEYADMMMVVGKKVEELIARIAQKARAAGIHLILATQRPSVDVITGLIKANIPTRISFQVSSKVDSRTVLDQQGAEQLLGNGDMLYLAPGSGVPIRVHGAFVSDDEVQRVVDNLKRKQSPQYVFDAKSVKLPSDPVLDGMGFSDGDSDPEKDALYDQAVAIVLETRRASASGIQRRLKIGYNRAARLMEAMEKAGLVSTMDSNGNRDILVPDAGEH